MVKPSTDLEPTLTTSTEPASPTVEGQEGLRSGVLGMFDTVVMAVAGSAPAYTIAGSTAALIAAVGLAGPAALLYCGIPMLGIAWAFSYLNRIEANAGASYAWVGRVLHPALGFIAGWSLVISATIFMVAGSLPAGSVTLSLFSASAANHPGYVLLVGSAWFLLMVGLVIAGVRVTARAQWIMSGVEVAILVLFAVLAIVHAASHHVVAFSWSWFGLSHFNGLAGFAAGGLIAAFYYWGWDVASNLNEEMKDSKRSAGIGGIIGVLIVFALYEIFTIATNLALPAKTISANAGDVLSVLGQLVWPGVGGKLMVVAVMLSTIATLETTLIQVTRSLFAMSRERTLPKFLGSILPGRQTPWLATIAVAVVSLGLFIGSNYIGSLNTILSDAISAIGLQVCVYYGLAGLTVVVAFRKILLRSAKNLVLIGLWPLLGALFMFWILYEFVKTNTSNAVVIWVGLGGLGIGVIPLVIYWAMGSPYFKQKPTLGAVVPEDADA
ncbi:MAG TPA: APC family permease [Streptosporangiaceae bacterium]|nr:APC family permease [Streptosporangiaceae bacterium]